MVRTVDGRLVALAPSDGRELWSYSQPVPRLSLRGTARPVIAGDLVLCGFDNGKVAAVELADGDLVADVKAGRSRLSAIKEEELPDNLRAMKPEQRADEVNRQMEQRKSLNDKLSALVAKRDRYVAEQRAKAPPKASSFDRVVEDTLKAQIKR